jgi:hypothetical protein
MWEPDDAISARPAPFLNIINKTHPDVAYWLVSLLLYFSDFVAIGEKADIVQTSSISRICIAVWVRLGVASERNHAESYARTAATHVFGAFSCRRSWFRAACIFR